MQLLFHPDEVLYTMILVTANKLQKKTISSANFDKDDLDFCNDMLGKVSRSFAAVIRQLPDNLQIDIMVFYLVLRALDTIEDDTWTFENKQRLKVSLLNKFTQAALLSKTDYKLDYDVGEGDELILLQQFDKVQRVFRSLPKESQVIIADITKRMAAGMAETVGKDLTQGTTHVPEYDKYCHYVAGLVGEGLSRLFSQSKLEASYLKDELYLSNEMGLFLQKTNILRDYLEDYVEGRTFWPQSIWKKHSDGSQDLGYFTNQTNPLVRDNSIRCINELVCNALELVPSCLAYLADLHCPSIFRFCAIPQVMAIATLAKCYANDKVFTGVVKIRKGLSCKLILRATNLAAVHCTFYEFAKSIERKAHKLKRSGFEDPNMDKLLDACELITIMTGPAHQRQQRAKLLPMALVAAVVAGQFFDKLTLVLLAMALVNYFFGPVMI